MLPPLPRCSGWAYSSLISPSRISLPRKGCRVGLHIVLFEACSAFTRVAACTLARSPIRDPLPEGFRHFVASMPAPVASGWSESPGGTCTHWKAPPCHGAHPIRDIQVLCPMNRGGLGARSLNIELQNALNPPGEIRIERFGWTFCPGDKVMQVENDYDKDVYNGDLGIVSRIDAEAGEIIVDFDGRPVEYASGELDELALAYATTIHKSQGSEYPAVVIPLATQHYPMLQKNLVYTGITRGKRLVVLVGQRRALAIAVQGQQAKRRWSKLREWLAAD